jgi:DNA invertase Pin-like site-specific DNA recombinase
MLEQSHYSTLESAANVRDCQKEAEMDKQKYTILYERLSRDDGEDSVSNSIKNQRAMLEEYAERNGLVPFLHIQDDGYSGTNWNRPGWREVEQKIEADEISALVIKDSSRMGRDYLRVGLYREMFREKGVRLIAVNDGIDTAVKEDDFTPFREIMAEWYARDTSRKIKSTLTAKGNSGKPLSNQAPYGFIKDPTDKNHWLVDPVAAAVVRQIFSMAIGGMGPWAIAEKLHDEKVECPAYYLGSRGIGPRKTDYDKEHPYGWSYNTVGAMLSRLEYCGHTVNFKGEVAHFKDKRYKRKPPETWKIFENTHEAIIDIQTFETVQRLRETVRRPNGKGEANPLTGIVYCADCGRKMYNKRHGNSDYYQCQTHKIGANKFAELCTPHHVKSAAVRELILDALNRTSGYIQDHEAEFVELVREKTTYLHGENVKSSKKQITKNERRISELDKLIVSIYEDKVKGILPKERFIKMSEGYEHEQAELKKQTAALQSALDDYDADTANAEKFIELVRRFTRFDVVTTVMLNELVDRVVVHEGEWSEGIDPVTKHGKGTRRQRIEVYLKYIGDLDIPDTRTQEEINAEIAAVEIAEKRLAKQRENRRRFVAGESKKRTKMA